VTNTVSEPLLVVEDLHVTYVTTSGNEVPAVRGVSFEVERGGSLGLAGESGCGKSTMANALLRLLPPGTNVSGQIMLDGEDVLTMSPGALRSVRWAKEAIVFQGALHALNPVRSVAAQVSEPMLIHRTESHRGAARKRVGDLLDQVGLPRSRSDAYPHQLSGGQRQRVLIAMALACDPDLLIADEPTTALDVMVQAQVLDLLASLRSERGLSMIFISHDLSVLKDVCDRIAVMYAGRVIEEGPSDLVFAAPEHPYSKALAAAFPTIGDPESRMKPSGLPGDPPDPLLLPSGCTFNPRCAVAIPECADVAIELRAVSSGRRAACVHVRSR
jgi:peptide/nickel transport system ATP-binding protein